MSWRIVCFCLHPFTLSRTRDAGMLRVNYLKVPHAALCRIASDTQLTPEAPGMTAEQFLTGESNFIF